MAFVTVTDSGINMGLEPGQITHSQDFCWSSRGRVKSPLMLLHYEDMNLCEQEVILPPHGNEAETAKQH